MRRFLPAALCVLALAGANAIAQDDPGIRDLKVRAEAGDKTAIRQMAEAYYIGKGVEQDFKQAAVWYEKLAKSGDVRAQTSLGLMYARGYGVAKNMQLAMKWWNLAAIQHDPGAQRRALIRLRPPGHRRQLRGFLRAQHQFHQRSAESHHAGDQRFLLIARFNRSGH